MAHLCRIDHELRLMAVISPKCASNSIHCWMNELARASGQGEGFDRKDADRIHLGQLPEYPDYRSVLFIRDPLRRLVSFHATWVVRAPHMWCFADQARRFKLQGKSFRQLLYVLDHLDRHGLPFQHHLEPQHQGLPTHEFTHVILTEELTHGFRVLNEALGLDVDAPHRHRTSRKMDLKQYVGDRKPAWLASHGIPEDAWFFDAPSAELARRLYAEDVALYERHGGQVLGAARSE
jgi:hypothetical protein